MRQINLQFLIISASRYILKSRICLDASILKRYGTRLVQPNHILLILSGFCRIVGRRKPQPKADNGSMWMDMGNPEKSVRLTAFCWALFLCFTMFWWRSVTLGWIKVIIILFEIVLWEGGHVHFFFKFKGSTVRVRMISSDVYNRYIT